MVLKDTPPKSAAEISEALLALRRYYRGLRVFTIGGTTLGRRILCGSLGRGRSATLVVGAHHGLEWITSYILLRFIEEFLWHLGAGEPMLGYDPAELFRTRRMYILPLLNVDGVDLVLRGPQRNNPYRDALIRQNGGSEDFGRAWQANARGVDLNHNYNAGWIEGKVLEKELGIIGPGPTRYGGPFWESEAETRALTRFVKNTPLRHVTAYHTQGEVIYDQFKGKRPEGTAELSHLLSAASGYAVDETAGIASYRGFKDWVIDKLGVPGFTIEAGLGKNPLPFSDLDALYQRNREMLLILFNN